MSLMLVIALGLGAHMLCKQAAGCTLRGIWHTLCELAAFCDRFLPWTPLLLLRCAVGCVTSYYCHALAALDWTENLCKKQ